MLDKLIARTRQWQLGFKLKSEFSRHRSSFFEGLANKVEFAVSHSKLTPWDILIERQDNRFCVSCSPVAVERTRFHGAIIERAVPYIYYMTRAGEDADHLIGDTSDGDRPSVADVSFSSMLADRSLVPDLYFFRTMGYEKQRAQHANGAAPWHERSDDIIWRGGMNGTGLEIVDQALIGNGAVNQRLRMALACKPLGVDFRFVGRNDAFHILKAQGLLGDRVEAHSWLGRKYAIDIDGHSNAWDNLFHRLLFGCCVFKVDSQAGFRQWYYHKLEPYKHFIPIKADLSNLAEQIDWARSHPTKAQEIAQAGSALAHSMTFDSEMDFAAQEIRRICHNKKNTTLQNASS